MPTKLASRLTSIPHHSAQNTGESPPSDARTLARIARTAWTDGAAPRAVTPGHRSLRSTAPLEAFVTSAA